MRDEDCWSARAVGRTEAALAPTARGCIGVTNVLRPADQVLDGVLEE